MLPDDNLVYVGDYSSTIKVFDIRSSSSRNSNEETTISPLSAIPNSPAFCGDACPVAALYRSPTSVGARGGGGGVLVSSSIGWWTANRSALEEAPEDQDQPIGCLNLHWLPQGPVPGSSSTRPPPAEYLHTLRLLQPGVITCMAADSNGVAAAGTRFLVGTSAGDLVGVSVAGEVDVKRHGGGGRDDSEEGLLYEDGLPIGLEELLSSDED